MSFTAEQIEQLLRPINKDRVLHANNQSHVSQQDIRAHLIRIFGFGGWDKEILEFRLVRDEWVDLPGTDSRAARTVPAVTYLCRLRLTVWCPERCCRKVSDDVGTGTSPNLPSYGDAHDFAAKNAVSYALKRCATDLGDQFGLSLYNKGQTRALVIRTLVGQQTVHPPGQQPDEVAGVDAGVDRQVSLGDEEGGGPPEHQAAEPPPAGRADGALRKALGADIARVGTAVLGLSQTELHTRFAGAHGTTVAEASTDQLRAFRDALRAEAEQAQRPAADAGAPPDEGS